ncbi:MAG TPA: hypothetical protein VFP70_11080 [Burkholderiales bacterium]|nr:hypothetical protein [Burkholderiales bacterium]
MARKHLGLAGAGAALVVAAWAVAMGVADAAKTPNVSGTRHNLSVSGTGTVRAVTEAQVCVFCHTPHGARTDVTPLWNRQSSGATYTPYTSTTLDANDIQATLDQPGGSSKLCLSCHDGTLAIGNVNVLNGVTNATIQMQGTATTPPGTMPEGSGAQTGFTRRLGVDLRNDHPISVTFTSALATRDGELRPVDAQQRWPAGTGTTIGIRGPGFKPHLPLEPTGAGALGQVQCGTCHDPHLLETDPANGNQKFLRQNRFQQAQPAGGTTFDAVNDIICLGCHTKELGNAVWAFSAHAHQQVANETYVAAAAATREFPTGLPVWRAACMNCHDTHTVQGAKRLLREGTSTTLSGTLPGGFQTGAASADNFTRAAQENTCYQCHSVAAESAVTGAGAQVPNIKSDFNLARRMPINAATEAHEIGVGAVAGGFNDGTDCTAANTANRCGADMIEPRVRLGVANPGNRHAECTDCHNPHRVIKSQNGVPGALNVTNTNAKAGTHRHEDAAGYTHANLISGVLRGAWGVEPQYPDASFHTMPNNFLLKRGDPGADVLTTCNDTPPSTVNKTACDSKTYVTREYQICLKCHSNYGYDDDNVYPSGNLRPLLGGTGLTPVTRANDARSHTRYTNQAKEFQAPNAHKGAPGAFGTAAGAAATYNNGNNRSWHPVMDVTGRTLAVRGGNAAAWLAPWNNAVGTQTMYCSDCHGSSTGTTASVMPTGNTNTSEDGNPWGPHGSTNDFILKGIWNNTTGANGGGDLCLKCHAAGSYANQGGTTGFATDKGDGHDLHAAKIGRMRCNWCHVAVPHGWKNMSLLVNLNDVGPEVGLTAGTQVRNNTTAAYTNGPYYRNAINKVRVFRSSGTWVETDCGSQGAPGNGQTGRNWMRDSNENCTNPP